MRHRSAIVSLAVAGGLLFNPGVAHAVDCLAIVASTDPATNYSNIQSCLDTDGAATLLSGDFPVPQHIAVGTDDDLSGSLTGTSTLRLSTTPASEYLLKFTASGGSASHLTIDADNMLGENGVMIQFLGSNNTLSNNVITGGANPALSVGNHPNTDSGPTTVSVTCTTCSGNVISDNELTANYAGIVFHGASSSYSNVAENNEIHDNQCDTVTFVGYGVFRNNNVYENGGYCYVGRGGGIYSTGNAAGGVIEGNTVQYICGHGIDLINSIGLQVLDNDVRDPGTRSVDPSRTFCGAGAAALSVVNVRGATIEDNYLRNVDAPWNQRIYGSTTGFKDNASGVGSYADLPNGGNTLFAMYMVWSGSQTWTTRSNYVNNNTFSAACSTTGCVGMSLYVGRGTGVYANQTSDSASWNKFEGNIIYGSEYRTVRGGRNWWAGNNSNPANAGNPDPQITYCDERTDRAVDACNDDDYQHNPPSGSTYRNDQVNHAGTQFYTYSIQPTLP